VGWIVDWLVELSLEKRNQMRVEHINSDKQQRVQWVAVIALLNLSF
jgi:hypothetical protein